MTPRTLIGRHYQTGQPILLTHHHGRITQIQPAPEPSPTHSWIAPSLVDLQVNGFAGVDFQHPNLQLDHLQHAVAALNQAGCGRFLLTLITDSWPTLLHRLAHLRQLRKISPQLQHAILGWHIEGPFLSEQPGFHGAHNPHHMINPSPTHIAKLRQIAGNDPLLLTLAPERPGALDAIRTAVSLNIRVSLGHTNAAAETLTNAWNAGATGFTHLGNACPRELDRHDNILWRVLDALHYTHAHPAWISLIPDTVHVSAPLFRLIHRCAHPASIVYVSDAMAAADAPPGNYTLGELNLHVDTDGVVRQPGQTNFAGSSLQPIAGVNHAAEMLNEPWPTCWDRFSVAPAACIGISHGLHVGCPADLCLLETPVTNPLTPSPTLKVTSLLLAGQETS